MPEIPVTTEELYRLYSEGRSLAEIAARYNVTRQAIHERFRRVGLPRRKPGGQLKARPAISVDVREFERMYVGQGLSLGEIAKRLKVPGDLLRSFVIKHPRLKKLRRGIALFPQLNTMKVGESFLVPKVGDGKDNYTRYYMLVRRLGIRVSVTTASKTKMRVTRVA